jgi:hypothetical protein
MVDRVKVGLVGLVGHPVKVSRVRSLVDARFGRHGMVRRFSRGSEFSDG